MSNGWPIGEAPPGPFLFAIESCFTIEGRGTVVAGTTKRGTVRIGDDLDVRQGGTVTRTKCLGVELLHLQDPDGSHSHGAGLLLDGIERFDPAPGDCVVAVE